MRYFMCLALMVMGLSGLAGGSARALPICPTTANTNSDCSVILTIGPGNTVTSTFLPGAAPYDGSDDALIGVVNNSGSVFTGSFILSGTGNGGGIFGFDGDGICAYISATYCATAPTGYEGPLNTFTAINASQTSGTVSFAGVGIADGATTYFSLEGSAASIQTAGGIGVPTITTPEPATLAIVGVGLAGLLASRRKRA